MIGDLILWFDRFRRQLCCKHEYKREPDWAKAYGDPHMYFICTKCGRMIAR